MRELEQRSGIAHSTLMGIEAGRSPAPDRVARLGMVLHIPVAQIERAMGIDLGSQLLPWHQTMQIQERLSDAETARIRRYQEQVVAERGTNSDAEAA